MTSDSRGKSYSADAHPSQQYATMNEAELSEYLLYLTCPICEEVRERTLRPQPATASQRLLYMHLAGR